MLVVYSPIFVVDSKITFAYNFVGPLKRFYYLKAFKSLKSNGIRGHAFMTSTRQKDRGRGY